MTSPTENNPLPPDLAQIQAEAAALTPPHAANDAAGAPVEPVTDFLSDATDITSMIFEGVGSLYPSTAVVLNPKQARFAGALAKVMEKRNWSLAALLGRYGAEIELAFVASTLAIPLVKAIQHDRAIEAAANNQAEQNNRNSDPQPVRPVGDPYSTAFAADSNG